MRVLVVRLGSMGDVLHALPAVAALREARPNAHIGWAIERRWTPLLVAADTPLSGPRSPQRPLVDAVHVVDTIAWRKAPFNQKIWSEVRGAFRDIRAQRYDVCVDFQGAIKSAVVARFSGAPVRIGFAQPREKAAAILYTSTTPANAKHVIDQNLALVSTLIRSEPQSEIRNHKSGRPLRTSASQAVALLPADPAAEAAVEQKVSGLGHFAILAPGAGWGAKQWPAARYGEVARALRADGLASLVNYAPGEETLAREVEAASDGAAQMINCTLPELIALTRRASLFVGGDTGPMHLANALRVPVVALFGPTDPARTGPYPPNAEIANQTSEIAWGRSIVLRHPSSRTDRRHLSDPDPGLLQISVTEVTDAARLLLNSGVGPVALSRSESSADRREPNADSTEPHS